MEISFWLLLKVHENVKILNAQSDGLRNAFHIVKFFRDMIWRVNLFQSTM